MHCTLVWASKGGSGKTTTTANLAAALALDGYNVLAVDADPDGDLSHLFGIPETAAVTRLEQLLADPSLPPAQHPVAIPLPAGAGRLQLLPCTQHLEHAAMPLAQNGYRGLRQLLDSFEPDTDLALIDVPGARGPFVTAALKAADSLLLPISPGDFERSAIHRAITQSRADAGYPLATLGVAFVNTPLRSRALREHHQELTQAGIPVLAPHVRRAASILRDPTRGGPAVISTPKTDIAADYRALAQSVLARILHISQP